MRKFIKYIILTVNLLAVLLLTASYILPAIDPAVFWWPSLLGLAYPYLLFLNVAFVIFWLLLSWKYLFISLICILAGINIHRNYIQFSGRDSSIENGIKVMSFNVNHFYAYLNNKDAAFDMLDFIASIEADIICLQETKLQKSGELNPVRLKSRFPGIAHVQLAHQSAWNGPVTFSRFPIVAMGEMRFENSNNMVIFTDLKMGTDTVRVYNCHLQSYGIRPEDYTMIDTLSFQKVNIDEMKMLGGKLRNGYKLRSKQVDQLKRHIDECRYPVIVCGDFNDTPTSFTYKTIASDLNDAFVESGRGISNTYRGKLPSYRIDYILYSNDFNAHNYRRYRVEYSDHFPISATLVRSIQGSDH